MKYKDEVPDLFYRVSVKALIYNDTRDKFLIVQETNGKWEMPGGGLEWGAEPSEEVSREIMEEMGIKTVSVAPEPSYFLTVPHDRTGTWTAQVFYETVLENLDFVPSRECSAVRFIGPDEVPEHSYSNVIAFAKQFKPGG